MMGETSTPFFKITILGNSGVGKTCLLHRCYWDDYEKTLPTIGYDLVIHYFGAAKLSTRDTGGAYSYRPFIIKRCFHDTDGYLLVFDLQDHRSFEAIRDEWYPLLPEGSQCVLVGHKCDRKKREVSGEEAEKLAQELGMPYMEASAATGHNVDEVFRTLVRQIYKEKQRKEQQLCEDKQQR